MKIIFTLLLSGFILVHTNAQNLKIKSYSIGYRFFEIDAVGNNPLTIGPFLKHPAQYQNFINSIQYNGVSGNPGIQHLRTYYFNIEFDKFKESVLFRNFSLQTGLIITNKLVKSGMVLDNQDVIFSSNDTTFFDYSYSLTQKQQFIGINVGLNRRIAISKKINFLTGLNLQGSFAFVHTYEQRLDSFTNSSRNGIKILSSSLPNMAGKNFFQWQAMIPIALEFNLYKSLLLRVELDAGLIGSRYRKTSSKKEAHGFGLWLNYKK